MKGMVEFGAFQTAENRSATVNFMRNFRALSKSVEFHPCASAQGRDSKEDEGVQGRRRKGERVRAC